MHTSIRLLEYLGLIFDVYKNISCLLYRKRQLTTKLASKIIINKNHQTSAVVKIKCVNNHHYLPQTNHTKAAFLRQKKNGYFQRINS